ncbi:MAG: peptidyl-prolyl cis-trans isomerase, partial [Candidatus Marinimicrobia bacterium]|nr:peptidyl-prolyl cis-trans isomerase [Candidatus Neomarinimicrobiota bacterium]
YKELLANKFLDYHLSEKISVSDQELVSFYNKNRTSFQLKKARARIVHYLFDNIDDANSSKRILLYGDISQKNELTERFFPEKKMVTEGKLISVLDKAIFKSRQQHSILGPLRSEFGYHVVEISEYFPANSYLPVAEVKNIIRERIGNNKRNIEYKNLLKTLKDKYDIKTP